MITVRAPNGREVRISAKLFRSVYRSQGYRPLSEAVVVPAEHAPVIVGGDASPDPVLVDTSGEPLVPPPGETATASPLIFPDPLSLARAALNEYATTLGIESPETFPNKASLIAAIDVKRAEAGQVVD